MLPSCCVRLRNNVCIWHTSRILNPKWGGLLSSKYPCNSLKIIRFSSPGVRSPRNVCMRRSVFPLALHALALASC
jgi:hypothetical protein